MTRGSTWRSLLTAALVGLSAVFAALALERGPSGLLGGFVGAILLVPLPGYALMRAFFGGRDLEGAERLVVVLGLGLSSAIVSGLVLSVTPTGMTAASWATLLAVITVVGLLLGAFRETRASRIKAATAHTQRTDTDEVLPPMRAARRGRSPSLGQLAMLVAALLIAVLAVLVARVGAVQQPHPGFTQLWALPDGTGAVRVGVSDQEGMPAGYTLRVLVDGLELGSERTIELAHGQTWETTLTVPAEAIRSEGSVLEAELYRAGETQPYRRVHVSIGGEAGGSNRP